MSSLKRILCELMLTVVLMYVKDWDYKKIAASAFYLVQGTTPIKCHVHPRGGGEIFETALLRTRIIRQVGS